MIRVGSLVEISASAHSFFNRLKGSIGIVIVSDGEALFPFQVLINETIYYFLESELEEVPA